ncbi:hypothetical protein [Noviherbaspirillum sp.]|uniref:hypothetical protein n=1 Tax=Noviherbaspirillum sp. TaxID=1926288 RepID=UPI002FE0CA68
MSRTDDSNGGGRIMGLAAYIRHEVTLVRESRRPNAISVRFVQLHEQAVRTANEEEEYRTLHALMRTRWRWYKASMQAAKTVSRRKDR